MLGSTHNTVSVGRPLRVGCCGSIAVGWSLWVGRCGSVAVSVVRLL